MFGNFQPALTQIFQFVSFEMEMLNFLMVRSAVPGPLLLPPVSHRPGQGGTRPERSTGQELRF